MTAVQRHCTELRFQTFRLSKQLLTLVMTHEAKCRLDQAEVVAFRCDPATWNK